MTIATMGILLVLALSGDMQATTKYVPRLADGGGWSSTIVVTNKGTIRAIRAVITFIGEDGRPMDFEVAGRGRTSGFALTIRPAELITLETLDTSPILTAGWAQIDTEDDLAGMVVLRQRVDGRQDYEASAQIADQAYARGLMPFDNTKGYSTGLAFSNVTGANDWVLIIRDESGVVITTKKLSMDSLGHAAFSLPQRYPELAGKRGTISFAPTVGLSGRFMAVGFRFNPTGPFTTIQ